MIWAAIWYPILLLVMWGGCYALTGRERKKIWPGSPRTTRSDQPYLWEYEISTGRKRRPVASRMGIGAAIPFQFAVEEERWTHKLSKWFGFCEEFQTEDNDFDQRVFIISDNKIFQQKLRADIELHQLITRAFGHGVKRIYGTPQHLVMLLEAIVERLPEDKEDVLVPILHGIRKHLASSASPANADQALPAGVRVFKALLIFSFVAALATFILNLVFGYKIIDLPDLGMLLVKASAAISLALLVVMRVMLARSSYGHEVLMKFLGITICGIALSSAAVLWFVNCHYDRGVAELHTEKVMEKHISHGRRSGKTYNIRIANWHEPDRLLTLSVSYGLYSRLNAGDPISIYAQPGYFGLEWISKIEQTERLKK